MLKNIHRQRLIVLWLLLLMGMVLHFNYHVGDIFYGIDVVHAGANGKVPFATYWIKTIYYHLPIVLILLLLYVQRKVLRTSMFGLGLLYTVSHAIHLVKEIGARNTTVQAFTQINLLLLVLVISLLMNVSSWRWLKSLENEE